MFFLRFNDTCLHSFKTTHHQDFEISKIICKLLFLSGTTTITFLAEVMKLKSCSFHYHYGLKRSLQRFLNEQLVGECKNVMRWVTFENSSATNNGYTQPGLRPVLTANAATLALCHPLFATLVQSTDNSWVSVTDYYCVTPRNLGAAHVCQCQYNIASVCNLGNRQNRKTSFFSECCQQFKYGFLSTHQI